MSAQEIQDLRTDPEKSGFLNTFFGSTSDTASSDAKKYYRLGEKMYSEICDTEEPPNCTSQYLDAFPIPKQNIYGMCNNYSSAIFMKSEESECTQIEDLLTSCETTYNPEFYSARLKVFAGQALSSDKLDVTVNSVYKLMRDGDVTRYEAMADGSLAPSTLSVSGSTATCSNILKEIAYTVEVDQMEADPTISKTAYLKVSAISADVIL